MVRGKTPKSASRLPVFATIRQGGEVFGRVWWKLVLLAAVPYLLHWIISYVPSLGMNLPCMPSSFLARHNFGMYLQSLLIYLPVDLSWIVVYSWTDVAKITIIADEFGGRSPRPLMELLTPHWRVLLGIVLLRLAVGWSQKLSWFLMDMTIEWARGLRPVFTILIFIVFLTLCALFVMMPFYIAIDKKDFSKSLRGSAARTRRYFWRILAVIAILAVPYVVFNSGFFRLLMLFNDINFIPDSVLNVVWRHHGDFLEMFYYSLGWCVLGSIYFSLRSARKPSPDF